MAPYRLAYTKAPSTLVRLIFHTEDLQPDVITNALGIQPHEAWAKGDLRRSSRPRPTGHWVLIPPCTRDESFDVQLRLLLDLIESLPAVFVDLVRRYEGGISVAYSSGEDNFGFYLDEDVVAQLARYGLSIGFDLYPVTPRRVLLRRRYTRF